MFYLLIVGSRTFTNYEKLNSTCTALLANYSEVTIVSGGARGADALAERFAREHGYLLTVFNADWETYGKSAGYRRNERMHKHIAQYPNRGCVAFWDGQSKGTQHNFALAKKYCTQLRIVHV